MATAPVTAPLRELRFAREPERIANLAHQRGCCDRPDAVFVTKGGAVCGRSAKVAKAAAVEVDDVPDTQRLDLALLLSVVNDPIALAEQVTKKDRQRLRSRSELVDADQ